MSSVRPLSSPAPSRRQTESMTQKTARKAVDNVVQSSKMEDCASQGCWQPSSNLESSSRRVPPGSYGTRVPHGLSDWTRDSSNRMSLAFLAQESPTRVRAVNTKAPHERGIRPDHETERNPARVRP